MWSWDSSKSKCLVSRDHMFFPWDGSLFSALKSWDSSTWAQLELSQDLGAKKSEPSQEKSTWSIFQAQIELSQDLRAEKVSHLREKSCDHEKLDIWILSYLKITCIFKHVILAPSMTFWAISGYPPYWGAHGAQTGSVLPMVTRHGQNQQRPVVKKNNGFQVLPMSDGKWRCAV